MTQRDLALAYSPGVAAACEALGRIGGPQALQALSELTQEDGRPEIRIEALQEADGDHGFVFVLDSSGSRAERRAVTVGFLTGERVAIASGLDGVRQVITEGAPFLRDGQAGREAP